MKSTELFSKVPLKLLWKKNKEQGAFPCSLFLCLSYFFLAPLSFSFPPFLFFSFSCRTFCFPFSFPSLFFPLCYFLFPCVGKNVLKQQNIYWLKAIMPKPRINITLRKYMLTLHDSPWRWKTDILFNQ